MFPKHHTKGLHGPAGEIFESCSLFSRYRRHETRMWTYLDRHVADSGGKVQPQTHFAIEPAGTVVVWQLGNDMAWQVQAVWWRHIAEVRALAVVAA
jgi:hypothetical protein